MKTHFATGPDSRGIQTRSACGRGTRITENVFSVSCLLCMNSDVFASTLAVAKAARETAFQNQEPRRFAEPWQPGHIACRHCNSEEFRYRGRSCHGHYDDYVCANCSETTSRLTETGMSF